MALDPDSRSSARYKDEFLATRAIGPQALLSSKRFMLAAWTALVIVSLACLAIFLRYTSSPIGQIQTEPLEGGPHSAAVHLPPSQPQVALDPFGPSSVLKGGPTLSFRDNLRSDVQYITSWVSAGWTNDVMTYINLIYLGLITDRVPIIAEFIPSHIGGHVPPIPFGQVFDVPRLRNLLGTSVLEWRDVKNHNSTFVDDIGCWNVWEAVQYREAFPRRSRSINDLNLDISYTKAPEWIKMIPNYEHDQHVTFWSLARLAFPTTRKASLVPPLPSPQHNISLPPDQHLLCYDYLYYVSAHQPFEMEYDYSPAWRYVGKYMHWTPELEKLADDYVRRAIGVPEDGPIPPFISIHVRHHDFEAWCGGIPVLECFAPLSAIARRVREVQQEIQETTGLTVNHVVMTSDERNATWWREVSELGWFTPDHTDTKALYGDWYPVLIDAVIQSQGFGFVGTDRSTMSIIAARRVESWQKGPNRLVKWGSPGADDH
ncbi:hypothetical protein DFH08DRAFT_844625 [Mycena albidolilacea]|uniref:Uncharacterized protein n=1 Tax=Mycena albidolilacea TaxID=1033008 RepID=A0AAD7AM06_9AGAR|nr:hypothetical protein DFH08DRAFT_844625 [Mycena albidolilacea]